MTTPTEAVKTLEKMLEDLQFQRRVSETSMLNGIETAIEAGIAALKGEGTRLPKAITPELIIKSSFGLVIRGFDSARFDARLDGVLVDFQPTPEAAIDALAAQLEKGGKS